MGILLATMPQAKAILYSFQSINANNILNANDRQKQLFVDVSAVGSQVLFQFQNVGTSPMSITDIYFDDGTLLGLSSISSGAGTSFLRYATPFDLPGGNAANVNFNTSRGFSAGSVSPVLGNGVNPGETVGILFNLIAGQTYADTINAMAMSLAHPGVDLTGGLRIGIHVQGFANGQSESFVNGRAVPDGGSTIVLLGLGLVGLNFLRRRFVEA